jgi:iron-sulfur cluster assembly protein
MLDMTENATSVIRTIAGQAELPADAGLRIASESPDAARLSVAPALAPEDDDHVVEKEGARVFLEPQAAAVLDDKVLDAQVGDGGNVEFLLSVQQR